MNRNDNLLSRSGWFLKRKIKRAYFLLEMAIAIALMGVLLSVLFRFLVSNARFEKKIEEVSGIILDRQRAQGRLEMVLTNIEPLSPSGDVFYTKLFPEEKFLSLLVCFNAGIDPDPEYSHALTGRVHLTKEGDFCLSYWPRSEEGYRSEVLLSGVAALEWEFLGRRIKKTTPGTKIAENWAWLNQWPKGQGSVPQMIRLRLWCGVDKKKEREPNLQFAFILPVQEPIALYK